MSLSDGNMKVNINNNVTYLTFPVYDNLSFIKHCFSTRLGGVSKSIFESMNLSFNRGDPDENVKENYIRISKAIGVNPDNLVFSAQDHHTYIRTVTEKDKGIGIWRNKDMQSVDGLITNTPGLVLVTHYADCVPLYFVDPIKKVIGLAHAGWRGTAAKIGCKMVSELNKQFSCNAKDLLCAIGPSIGKCCYEVDKACCDEFMKIDEIDKQSCIFPKDNKKFYLDLWEINRQLLISAGVLAENITVSNICTRCNSDTLFSHRATDGKRGGLAAFLSICDK